MWPVLVLTLALPLSLGRTVEPGCELWEFDSSSSTSVCCIRCKPGNRVVSRCGEEPVALCRLCENGTYVTDGREKVCLRCEECIGPMRVKKPCTASTNTVCECIEGFLCGDTSCSYCMKECGKGQEPTGDRACRPCPEGTFNDKIHHLCVKWSSRCPSPDQKIIAKGTASRDIICAPADDLKPTTPRPDAEPTKGPIGSNDYSSWTTLIIAIICTFLIIAPALPLLMAVLRKSGQVLKEAPKPVEAPAGRKPEPEQCSFCFPQEEHGSSSEVSLVSDEKPFELLV